MEIDLEISEETADGNARALPLEKIISNIGSNASLVWEKPCQLQKDHLLVIQLKHALEISSTFIYMKRGNNFIAVIEQYLSMKHISQGERDRLGYLFRQLDTNNDGVI